MTAMTPNVLEKALRDVVIANRILAHEGVVDAYGHVSVRHPLDPARYLLSRSRAPALVERGDIVEFGLEGKSVGGDTRAPYLERFIHGAVYEARPDVQAVVHAHAEPVLPFTISATPLRPVVHMASFIGARIPVWDIRDNFGDTNLLVVNITQGRDLAGGLGGRGGALVAGRRFVGAGRSLPEAIRIAAYLPPHARGLSEAVGPRGGKARVPGQHEAPAPESARHA